MVHRSLPEATGKAFDIRGMRLEMVEGGPPNQRAVAKDPKRLFLRIRFERRRYGICGCAARAHHEIKPTSLLRSRGGSALRELRLGNSN